MRFKHWPILAKFLALLVLLGGVAVFATVFSTGKMSAINGQYGGLITGPEKAALANARANKGLVSISRDIYRLALTRTPAEVAQANAQLAASKAFFLKNLDLTVAADPVHADAYNGFRAKMQDAMDNVCADAIRYGQSTDPADIAKATTFMMDRCEPALRGISDQLTKFNETVVMAGVDVQSQQAAAQTRTTILMTYAVVLGGLALVMAAGFWLILSGVVRPVKALTGIMTSMSQGQLGVMVPGRERRDELGSMARAADIFRKGLEDAEALREQARLQAERAEADRHEAMLKLADGFEKSVGVIISQVSSAATEMQAAATQLTATAEETSAQSVAVSAAAEEAGANVTSVASSAEELGASVQEIGRQVEMSASISTSAVTDADAAVAVVTELNQVAGSISGIVDLIAGLASQTNLLALNATIESARAGEAGKGFAVVASEVKALAGQTSKATTEISARIAQIQDASARAGAAIRSVTDTIQTINRANTTIASAVEQQSAATQEIVQAVNQASLGTQEVTNNISGVAQAAEQTGAAATQVLASSSELAEQASRLNHEMDRFLVGVRTGT
jgi:methyl-accepting chemotaxis protein